MQGWKALLYTCAHTARLRKSSCMKLQINGDERDFTAPLTLSGLVEQLGMKQDRVAVELNRDIVPRDRWLQTTLSDGDRLEIVHFVGGGLH
jgi:thiamine biosynthesis protein ThiS